MWERILDRLKAAKEMILHDSFNPELKPCIDSFNLFVLANRNEPDYWNKVIEDETQFLYENRYKIAHLFDVLIRWFEAQLYCYSGEDIMFQYSRTVINSRKVEKTCMGVAL